MALGILLAATLTHGVAVGEVTSSSAVVWTRTSAPAEVVLEYGVGQAFPHRMTARTTSGRDNTVRFALSGLEPSTRYRYRVRAEDQWTGSFRTAPSLESSVAIRFVWAGDLGGHGYCREERRGYEVFSRMAHLEPHFFIANGDMIYADSECPVERPERGRNIPGDFPRIDAPNVDWTDGPAVREVYLAHWRYNRADPHFQSFLSRVPMYAQWDDHEVINDFGAPWPRWTAAVERPGYPTLVQEGRRALFDFHPLEPHPDEPHRIYRSFRWGRDVELFILDARSYRSPNDTADRPGKTLLGEEQLSWLKDGLVRSDAIWKIVSSDVPLSIPTGSSADLLGRDAFADGTEAGFSSRTGFELELRGLLTYLDANEVRNVVFVVTDVHFAMSLRYEVDLDGDGEPLLFHELVSGPLSAVKVDLRAPDPTFRPSILFAEGQLFNFGFARIERDAEGRSWLRADIRDETGAVRFGSGVEILSQ